MMKNHFRLIALAMLLFIGIPAQKAAAQNVAVSYQAFYDQMSPYGQWVYDAQYGNVWVPNVEPGFRPYATDGHWVMTDNGNMWVSDVPWGWAAYHYGRWTYNGYYGWIWIPGYEWAPAWVSWRTGGGYYGWAPMGPGHVYGGMYEYPDNYWVFVNPNYLYHHNIYNYYERGDMGMYVHRTNYITYNDRDSRYYGPRREEIERETHHRVEVYRVSDARDANESHMGRHEVSVYRPAISRESEQTARPSNVIQGNAHPVRPEAVSENHQTAPPAFRQEQRQQMQNQQPQNQQYQQHQQQYQQEQHQQHQQQQYQQEQNQQHQQYQQEQHQRPQQQYQQEQHQQPQQQEQYQHQQPQQQNQQQYQHQQQQQPQQQQRPQRQQPRSQPQSQPQQKEKKK